MGVPGSRWKANGCKRAQAPPVYCRVGQHFFAVAHGPHLPPVHILPPTWLPLQGPYVVDRLVIFTCNSLAEILLYHGTANVHKGMAAPSPLGSLPALQTTCPSSS